MAFFSGNVCHFIRDSSLLQVFIHLSSSLGAPIMPGNGEIQIYLVGTMRSGYSLTL